MICVWIDEFVPCLKKTKTGELFDTESALKIKGEYNYEWTDEEL